LRDVIFHKPIISNFIIGSVTNYKGKQSNFNVIYLDTETMLPLDYEIYVFNLDHANKFDEPLWQLKYNYRDFYSLEDLSPASMY